MIITRIAPLPGRRSKKVRITLIDGASFCLYERECRRLGLQEGEELADGVYDGLLREIFIPRARHRVLHLLERQDYTRAALSRKLTDSGYPAEAVEDALSYAESYHYIDDGRYARQYIRYHQSVKSRRRLYMDLLDRGVSKELIEEALQEEYHASEEELMRALLAKRHYDAEAADQRERARAYRYLCSRGFSSEQVLRCLSMS